MKKQPSAEELESTFLETFGQNVRALRVAKTLTQAALAVEANLSSNYLARVERGEVSLSLWVANRIAQALGVSVSDIMIRRLPPPPVVGRPTS